MTSPSGSTKSDEAWLSPAQLTNKQPTGKNSSAPSTVN